MPNGFRDLPGVDKVLAHESVKQLADAYSHDAVVGLIRRHLEASRAAISNGASPPTLDDVVEAVRQQADTQWSLRPRRVINATGVVLHTNLGRAPLSDQALQAVANAVQGYSDLEFDLERGERGSRQAHVASLLTQVTGAEAALVVNNNASAVMLGLAALANGRRVIVSRGEAVEIGGGFRVPDVLAQSGATLVEVGTTNRTYASDYESAITEDTAAFLKVHASNFRVTGFTHTPDLTELVDIGKRHSIPVFHDLGSGCLLDTERFGLGHEPTVQESVAAGCALAFFSGDKLLGGPQAGIIVGRKDLVQRLSRHPLARAIRIDKLSLAALGATLLHYLKEEAETEIPTWRMIATPEAELKRRASRWAKAIGTQASLARGHSTIGGGSLPGETLPTWLVALDATTYPGGADALAAALRRADPPVIGRIEDDRVLLDPRTVLPEEEKGLVEGVRGAVTD